MDAYIIHSTCFSELCRKDEEVAIANLSGIQLVLTKPTLSQIDISGLYQISSPMQSCDVIRTK